MNILVQYTDFREICVLKIVTISRFITYGREEIIKRFKVLNLSSINLFNCKQSGTAQLIQKRLYVLWSATRLLHSSPVTTRCRLYLMNYKHVPCSTESRDRENQHDYVVRTELSSVHNQNYLHKLLKLRKSLTRHEIISCVWHTNQPWIYDNMHVANAYLMRIKCRNM